MNRVEYVVLKSGRRGYELLDPEGRSLGVAYTLLQAQRFAADAGVPLLLENGAEIRMGRPAEAGLG